MKYQAVPVSPSQSGSTSTRILVLDDDKVRVTVLSYSVPTHPLSNSGIIPSFHTRIRSLIL